MLISSSYLEFSNQPKQNRCPAQIPVQWSGVPIAIRGPNEARLTKEKIVREIKHRSEVRIYNRSSFCHSFHSGSLNGMTLSTAPFESRMRISPRQKQAWPFAIRNIVDHPKFYSRSHDAVIPVYDAAGNVIETRKHKGDFNEW